MKTFSIITTGIITLIGCQIVWADPPGSPTTFSDPESGWEQVQKAARLPEQPMSWRTQSPSREEVQQFFKQQADAAMTAAGQARAFYTEFPDSPHALAAKKLECVMLQRGFSQGGRSQSAYTAWANAQDALLADPKLSDNDRFDVRVAIAERKRFDPQLQRDWKAQDSEYEKALRELIKDYPQRVQSYDMLLVFAAESSDEEARPIATEILAHPVSDAIKEKAEAIMRRLDAVGKPLDIKFTALDGRKVDLSAMKGKVVLVDFWATWCGPCVGEIPHVKEAYEKYHSKGFEVVGISFDSDEQSLSRFVQSHDMPWPQYFDGKTWENKFGVQYAIDSIPTMWLVDKNGNLRTENARGNLAESVEKLLD